MQDTRRIAMHKRHESRGEFDYTCQSCVESLKLKRKGTGSAASDPGALQAIVKTWLETREGRAFHQSPYNWSVLYDSARGDLPVTVEKLRAAYYKLSRTYDLTVDANPELKRQRQREVPVETPEQREARETAAARALIAAEQQRERELFATWEKGLPGMNSMQILQYATAMKEDYMRRKYPRALPSTEPHPSTIRNERMEKKLLAVRAERQHAARIAPVIGASQKEPA